MSVVDVETGPKHFVTSHNLAECARQNVNVQASLDPEAARRVERGAVQLLDEPQPLLLPRGRHVVAA